jgi:hypothetical protein
VWWAGSNRADLYIGTRKAALCAAGREPAVESVHSADEALAVTARLLRLGAARASVRVWLSGGLCRPFLVPPLAGIRSTREAEKAVQAMAPQRSGFAVPCRVWLESDRKSPDRIAVAVPQEWLLQLLELLHVRGRRVASIRPWWASALQGTLCAKGDTTSALGVKDCDSVTVLMGSAGTFEMAATFTPIVDDDAARSALKRAMMSSSSPNASGRIVRLAIGESGALARSEAIALGHAAEVV